MLILPIAFLGFFNHVLGDIRSNVVALIGFGVIYGVVAALLDTVGIQRTKAQQFLVIGYILPLTTIIVSVLWLHEPITLSLITGGAMILAGGYVARMKSAQS